jgi:Uma2 family endonuclease
MNLVLDDSIRIPARFASFAAFRRWSKSYYPDRGDYFYLSGDVWISLARENLQQNQLRVALSSTIGRLVMDGRLGYLFTRGMRLVQERTRLSTEPDALFVSHKSLLAKRIRLEHGAHSLEVIGTPDMVLEVVNERSVQKDTVVLRELYAAAGIAEYWLVNPLGEELSFDILRLTTGGYAATRKSAGWMKSAVFGKSFRLEAQPSQDELPEYRLLAK